MGEAAVVLKNQMGIASPGHSSLAENDDFVAMTFQ